MSVETEVVEDEAVDGEAVKDEANEDEAVEDAVVKDEVVEDGDVEEEDREDDEDDRKTMKTTIPGKPTIDPFKDSKGCASPASPGHLFQPFQSQMARGSQLLT